MDFSSWIRDIPDFPKPGVIYKDISPLLQDPLAFQAVILALSQPFEHHHIEWVVGIEARGFILASAVAYALKAGFVMARKRGKLPYQTVSVEYHTEYSTDHLFMHQDAIRPKGRVLIVDDVLATGGTALAAADLVVALGGDLVGYAFLLELGFLSGRQKLGTKPVMSLVV
jgi:adenine phosphoribosyltransferase